MAVDESGIIYIAWADGRRADGNGDICFAKSGRPTEVPDVIVITLGINSDLYLRKKRGKRTGSPKI